MPKKVLIICTSHDKLGDTGGATGSWGEEVAAPYYLWTAKGYEVTIASIKGGEVPFDEKSLAAPNLDKATERMLLDDEVMKKLTESIKLEDVNALDFDAVFIPGGHGTCWDLPTNETLIKQVSAAFQAGKVVSAVCHGPNGLVGVKDANGEPIVKGRKVTGFSDAEEKVVGAESVVPFMLEAKLKELGGIYSAAPELWHPHAVRDGNLITGQNPGSSAKVGELVIEALSA